MRGRMNIPTHGGGGGGSELYVYAQKNEPEGKDGIWIRTESTGELPEIDKFTPSGVELEISAMYARYNNIPYNFSYGSAVASGTDIYILGGYFGVYNTYRYNTLDDTYTRLANIPYSFYNGSAVASGTDIYILGGSGSYKVTYRYNTLDDTYTRLTNIPYNFYNGSAVASGTDIYILGGFGDNKVTYRYNTLDDTYTRLANIPYNFQYGSAVVSGTDIYLLGGTGGKKDAYKTYMKYNNKIYIGTNGIFERIKICKDVNIPKPYFANIAQNNTFLNYPAYYGDGNSWQLLEE